ncbi:hypothetical protein Saa2_02136 [Streptomyces acidiscabies]|nr:hypothetical protein Saa2_02136 [Streptomyces acidiscabies]
MDTLRGMNAEFPSPAQNDPTPAEPPTPAHHFTVLLSATPRGVRLARRLSAERLDAWGCPYDTDAHRTAILLVAELATNAMRHGRLPGRDFRIRLALDTATTTLRIEATDARPERRPPTPGTLSPASNESESGRGLLLVEGLAERWGTECGDPYTKTVWCEVALK